MSDPSASGGGGTSFVYSSNICKVVLTEAGQLQSATFNFVPTGQGTAGDGRQPQVGQELAMVREMLGEVEKVRERHSIAGQRVRIGHGH
jgi:hypothetical protein